MCYQNYTNNTHVWRGTLYGRSVTKNGCGGQTSVVRPVTLVSESRLEWGPPRDELEYVG